MKREIERERGEHTFIECKEINEGRKEGIKELREKTRSGHDENRLILVDHWVYYKDGC